MKPAINFIKIFLTISLIAAIVSGILIYDAKQKMHTSFQLVTHSQNIIKETQDLFSLIKDAEIGQRGFILTNNPAYLEPYLQASEKINNQLAELTILTENDELQHSCFARVKSHIEQRLLLLKNTLTIYNSQGYDAAVKIIKTHEGKIAMDSVRSILNQCLEYETKLLEERNTELDKNDSYVYTIIYSSLCLMAILCIASLLVITSKESENKQLIKELNTSNLTLESEVKARTRELEETNEKLVHMNQEKNKFLGMAVHDLKNPLNTIKGLINVLEMTDNGKFSEEQTEILEHISKSTAKMSLLITNLLDINKIERGEANISLQKLDLFELLEGVVFSFKEDARKKGIRLVLNNHFPSKEIVSDKIYLTQILENLISNALKFSPSDKCVFILLKELDGQPTIDIQDEGPGILPEELPLLFNKFQKLSNRPTGGESSTGLGMSIVKHLVESLNGSIECTSEEGKGTTFRLILPQ